MLKKNIITYFLILLGITVFNLTSVAYTEETFNDWLKTYKTKALNKGISQNTLDLAFKNVKFLDQVIKYDRKQPEFYEDTITYVNKRSNILRVQTAKKLLKKNKAIFTEVENKFLVEKEILLSLWGIETNFGKHVGKMDIISCLATLSYDKRRREFFSSQLFILLKLIENKSIDINTLYGSWAGAYGNFQFMPSTINRYAIDYDKNNIIELKSTKDSFASAANYINKIGWKKNQPCFVKVNLSKNVPKKLLNTSAKKIHNKNKFDDLKKYINNKDSFRIDGNLIAAIITPDKDIIPNAENLEPAYIVFENYEKILQWNRSLRFGLAVCTLKEKFENAL